MLSDVITLCPISAYLGIYGSIFKKKKMQNLNVSKKKQYIICARTE